MSSDAPLRIIELRAENLKRLTAITIRPDGPLVQVTGKNGSGKTSTLDAIWWALCGAKNVQAKPIRKGAERALVKLDLGEIVVTRTFSLKDDGDYTTTLRVERADGPMKKPQDVLDALVGEIAFDPVAFGRMPPREQFGLMRVFVPGVDFEEIDRLNKADFDARTGHNRRSEDYEAQAAGITLPGGPVPKVVDIADLEARLGKASDENSTLAQRKARRETTELRCLEIQEQLKTLQTELDGLQQKLIDAGPLPDPVDVSALVEQLAEARRGNEVASRAKRKTDLETQARTEKDSSERLTKAIKARNEEKAAAVARAKMPVEGIGFGDGEVLLNGQPFNQASDAEQLRASIAIAGAMNPKLRVIRVRDGSLIDDDGMRLLETYAEENDLQIWVERVDSTGRIGFVLENGHLAGDPAVAAAAEEAI